MRCAIGPPAPGPGGDERISEEKIGEGVPALDQAVDIARFSTSFLHQAGGEKVPDLSPADAWILAELQEVILDATGALEGYDHAPAKSAVETFFWRDLADNYLEMAKKRLYSRGVGPHPGACWALERCLETTVTLFAPFLPYVTEAIYQALFARLSGGGSLHLASWPEVDQTLRSMEAWRLGQFWWRWGPLSGAEKATPSCPSARPWSACRWWTPKLGGDPGWPPPKPISPA